MRDKSLLAERLHLTPGYHAELRGADIQLIGPEGSPVAWLRSSIAPEVVTDGARDRTLGPVDDQEEWRSLCEALLMLARSHAVECEILREREERLNGRLEELKEELRVTHRVAETLYEFFSHAAHKAVSRERTREGGSGGYQTSG